MHYFTRSHILNSFIGETIESFFNFLSVLITKKLITPFFLWNLVLRNFMVLRIRDWIGYKILILFSLLLLYFSLHLFSLEIFFFLKISLFKNIDLILSLEILLIMEWNLVNFHWFFIIGGWVYNNGFLIFFFKMNLVILLLAWNALFAICSKL